MNEYYYYTLIRPFIPLQERAVINIRDRHYVALKSNKRQILRAYIYLHSGSPCGRYCICRYFLEKDVLDMYLSIQHSSQAI